MLQFKSIVQFIMNIVGGIVSLLDSFPLFSQGFVTVTAFDFILGLWITSAILGIVFVIARR